MAFFLDSFHDLHKPVHISEGVTIDVSPHELIKSVLGVQQLKARTTDASHLGLIQENAKLPTAILSRIKPVNRFFSIAQVVQPDRGDIEFRKREPVPIFLHRGNRDRKSTRLNSSHTVISYAVFCLKKKKK